MSCVCHTQVTRASISIWYSHRGSSSSLIPFFILLCGFQVLPLSLYHSGVFLSLSIFMNNVRNHLPLQFSHGHLSVCFYAWWYCKCSACDTYVMFVFNSIESQSLLHYKLYIELSFVGCTILSTLRLCWTKVKFQQCHAVCTSKSEFVWSYV